MFCLFLQVLDKCQLRESIQEKSEGLDAPGKRSSCILTRDFFFFQICEVSELATIQKMA
jgi:hypothetical protein